jgi:hypothetical protein
MNQTRQPDQWIIIDDGKVPCEWLDQRPLKSPGIIHYVRREPRPDDPRHTLILNLKAALPLIKGDKVLIIEDDEYYAPEYIEEMAQRLDWHELVGIMHAKYYHLPSGGYCQLDNSVHASLAETGFRASIVPEFSGLWDGSSCIDLRLWNKVNRVRSLLFIDTDKPLYLGIKGLPGRAGIGGGHAGELAQYQNHKDTMDRAILKQWVPQDYRVYLDVLSGKLTKDNYGSYFQ